MNQPLGRKLNFEKHKLPQARTQLLSGEAGQLPMNSPQCHICFQGSTATRAWWGGGRMGGVLENFATAVLHKTDEGRGRGAILGVFR